MCGICGKLSNRPVSIDSLTRMADQIHHRGPDDEGFFVKNNIGLASRRLSIIDLVNGNQPISNEDGTIWIVFNGEIYNYPELRRWLSERGHYLKTQTDTEVIVHLYEEYGVDCVTRLRGMFAFALWDEKGQRLFLARDPLGQKPLYYFEKPNYFVFASEIKALLADKAITAQFNPVAMHHYISLRYIPDSDTFFEGVSKLPAGHILILENGNKIVRQYWDLSYTPKLPGSLETITTQLRQQLLETVESHLLSDVPLGAFLSGGLDSTLIAAMMSTLSDKPIKTFSIGVREQDFNELPYARMVAKKYGTDHHEFIVESNLVSALPEMMWYMEEPVDPFAFGIFSVAKLARQHVKVVLGGDGGDELFAGYDRYLGNQLVDLYCLLPETLRRYFVEPIINRLPDNYSYNNRVQKLRWLVAMSNTSAGERYAASASFLRFSDVHKQTLYTDKMWQKTSKSDSLEHLIHHFNADNALHAIDKMLYTDVRTRLPDHLLMIADRMTMAHSIEGRSPYVDHKLAEFVASIPAQFKLRSRQLKHIQRRIAKEYLPEQLIHRGKQGFSFPLAYWFKSELRELTTNLFLQSNLVAEGHFSSQGMMRLLEEHTNGAVDHNYRLWLLVNLELWHRMFIEGRTQDELSELLINLSGQRSSRETSDAKIYSYI